MYVVLSNARLNVGDFLITHRCRALLRRHKPDDELVQYTVFDDLTPHLDVINASKALVIMGGPGYRPRMYPENYRLAPRLADIRVPIVILGVGWNGARGDLASVESVRFAPESRELLDRASSDGRPLGCRDFYTWQVLRRNGYGALMSGCPAWYDLDSLGKPFDPPGEIRRVAFTPVSRQRFASQTIELARVLRETFPTAELAACFHQGFEKKAGSGTEEHYRAQRAMAYELERLGFDIQDLSAGVERFELYRQFDLHVGYRVHAHIHFLSRRRPSILIYEDGRGAGVDDALGLPGIAGYGAATLAERSVAASRLQRLLGRKPTKSLNEDAATMLRDLLAREIASGFVSYAGIAARIDANYEIMSQFLATF